MIDLTAINPRPDSFDRLLKLVNKQAQAYRFARPRPRKPAATSVHVLARQIERQIAQHIGDVLGYPIYPTPPNFPFDLWVAGARVEVKASRWINLDHKARYQAAIRNHAADVVIFDAINGTDHYFIIPMQAITPKRTIEITRYDVTVYRGQWAQFLNAWDWLHRAVELAPPQPIQLTIWEPTCHDMNISSTT